MATTNPVLTGSWQPLCDSPAFLSCESKNPLAYALTDSGTPPVGSSVTYGLPAAGVTGTELRTDSTKESSAYIATAGTIYARCSVGGTAYCSLIPG